MCIFTSTVDVHDTTVGDSNDLIFEINTVYIYIFVHLQCKMIMYTTVLLQVRAHQPVHVYSVQVWYVGSHH